MGIRIRRSTITCLCAACLVLLCFVAFSSKTRDATQMKVTKKISFTMKVGDDDTYGDIVIGLFGDDVPKTVNNFFTIATQGVNGKTYAGSQFHRVIKSFMIQGGDIIKGDGTGSTSIYGGKQFDDENFHFNHTGPGFLSMANSGPNSNGCQFFITTVPTPWLDGKHVIFGKVIDGFGVVKRIERLATDRNNRPHEPVVIKKSSSIDVPEPFYISDKPH